MKLLKLDRWLQFGGHDEGERSPVETAVRELAEESGLESGAARGGGEVRRGARELPGQADLSPGIPHISTVADLEVPRL